MVEETDVQTEGKNHRLTHMGTKLDLSAIRAGLTEQNFTHPLLLTTKTNLDGYD